MLFFYIFSGRTFINFNKHIVKISITMFLPKALPSFFSNAVKKRKTLFEKKKSNLRDFRRLFWGNFKHPTFIS